MSTLYEAALELKKALEARLTTSDEPVIDAYTKLAGKVDACPQAFKRLLNHNNPAALTDYVLACYITKAEKPHADTAK